MEILSHESMTTGCWQMLPLWSYCDPETDANAQLKAKKLKLIIKPAGTGLTGYDSHTQSVNRVCVLIVDSIILSTFYTIVNHTFYCTAKRWNSLLFSGYYV